MGQLAKTVGHIAVSPAQSTSIQFTDDTGAIVTITSDDIRMHICPQADERELTYFMELCRAQRLNPFLNEAYLVKYGGKPAQMMVAHKVLMKRAEANEQFDGMEYGVTVMRDGGIHHEQRGAFYKQAGEELIGGWCKVYRKDRRVPYYAERSLQEMSKQQSTWKSMPAVMICKCAQAAAIRDAFPDDMKGMYIQEEMGQTIEAEVETPVSSGGLADAVEPTVENVPEREITDEEKAELRALTDEFAAMGFEAADMGKWLYAQYLEGGIEGARQAAENVRATAKASADAAE